MPNEEPERLILTPKKSIRSREERAAFGFIAFCGVGAAVLGGLFFLSNVRKPFFITYNGPRYATSAEKESAEVARQRIADTDADGITDYDELNIFQTSPYIEDTDSDGRSDGVEVTTGEDPLCPVGKVCSTTSSAVVGSVPEFLDISAPTTAPSEDVSLDETIAALRNLSVTEVREFLTSSGMEAGAVAALSDAQVMELYLQALGAATADMDTSSNQATTQETPPAQNPSP